MTNPCLFQGRKFIYSNVSSNCQQVLPNCQSSSLFSVSSFENFSTWSPHHGGASIQLMPSGYLPSDKNRIRSPLIHQLSFINLESKL